MSRSLLDVLKVIEENKIEVIEFKMKDTSGRVHTTSLPSRLFTEEFVQNGIPIDTTKGICVECGSGDAVFVPNLDSTTVDLFGIVPGMTICGNIKSIYMNNEGSMRAVSTEQQEKRGNNFVGDFLSIISLLFGILSVLATSGAVFSMFLFSLGGGFFAAPTVGAFFGFVATPCVAIAIICGLIGKTACIRSKNSTAISSIGLTLGIVSNTIISVLFMIATISLNIPLY